MKHLQRAEEAWTPMNQSANESAAENRQQQQHNPNRIPGGPDFGGMPDEHTSVEHRTGEIAYYVQMAMNEARAATDRVEDRDAQQLYSQVADSLDQCLQALYAFQGGDHSKRLHKGEQQQ